MKHVLVIYEGAAGKPSAELEGATALELARNIHATAFLGRGMSGSLQWPYDDPSPRTEHALATVLGVVPQEARALRRGPVEAAATSLDPSRWTYAYRGNFITTDGQIIRDNRVAGLSLDETNWLAGEVRNALPDSPLAMEVTAPGRVSVVFDRLSGDVEPGEFPEVGARVEASATSRSSDRRDLMKKSMEILAGQSLNDVRVDLGENPASMLWLWGGGSPASISRPFLGAPLKAAMVTHSPLARGLAVLGGMKGMELGDLWAEVARPEIIDADILAACINAHDLTVVYVEAPLEGGSYGTPAEKVKALDRVDIHVLARVAAAMDKVAECRLMVVALPGEGVFMESTPVLLSGSRVSADTTDRWDDVQCGKGAIGRLAAGRCLSRLLGE